MQYTLSPRACFCQPRYSIVDRGAGRNELHYRAQGSPVMFTWEDWADNACACNAAHPNKVYAFDQKSMRLWVQRTVDKVTPNPPGFLDQVYRMSAPTGGWMGTRGGEICKVLLAEYRLREYGVSMDDPDEDGVSKPVYHPDEVWMRLNLTEKDADGNYEPWTKLNIKKKGRGKNAKFYQWGDAGINRNIMDPRWEVYDGPRELCEMKMHDVYMLSRHFPCRCGCRTGMCAAKKAGEACEHWSKWYPPVADAERRAELEKLYQNPEGIDEDDDTDIPELRRQESEYDNAPLAHIVVREMTDDVKAEVLNAAAVWGAKRANLRAGRATHAKRARTEPPQVD